MSDILDEAAVDEALTGLPGWRRQDGLLLTAFVASSAGEALEFVAAIGEVAEEIDHHPDVDWRYDHVFVATTSHDVGRRITARDVTLARRITSLAVTAPVDVVPDAARPGA